MFISSIIASITSTTIIIVTFGRGDLSFCPLGGLTRAQECTPSPPTKSLDFGGFDSSRLLILRGGNSHVRIIL